LTSALASAHNRGPSFYPTFSGSQTLVYIIHLDAPYQDGYVCAPPRSWPPLLFGTLRLPPSALPLAGVARRFLAFVFRVAVDGLYYWYTNRGYGSVLLPTTAACQSLKSSPEAIRASAYPPRPSRRRAIRPAEGRRRTFEGLGLRRGHEGGQHRRHSTKPWQRPVRSHSLRTGITISQDEPSLITRL
jgi:hypothetical protein